jgi:hypothetical protein
VRHLDIYDEEDNRYHVATYDSRHSFVEIFRSEGAVEALGREMFNEMERLLALLRPEIKVTVINGRSR